MGLSDAALEGAALAATLLGDRDGTRAAAGLIEETAGSIAQMLADWQLRGARDRVRHAAGLLRPTIALDREFPPRMQVLLATDVPRPTADAWIAAAPPPRRSPPPSEELRTVLRRLAGVSASETRIALDRAAALGRGNT